MSMLMALWGRTANTLVIAAAVLAALFGVRRVIRKNAKEEMRNEIRDRTLERIEVADSVERDINRRSDDDILDKLRDNGWLRD